MSDDKRCPRCKARVYFAEEVWGGGKAYHKKCFNCLSCNKKLDSVSLCERDDNIYCKTCYGREFGPKGYGFGQGAGTLSTFSKDDLPAKKPDPVPVKQLGWCGTCNAEKDGKFCGDCGGKLEVKAVVEKKPQMKDVLWCSACDAERSGKFCGECGGKLETKSVPADNSPVAGRGMSKSVVEKPFQTARLENSAAAAEEGKSSSNNDDDGEASFTVERVQSKSVVREPLTVPRQSLPAALKPKGKFGGGVSCTRCQKTVYDAERQNGPNGLIYHSKCFTCLNCNKKLSAIDLCDREGEIHCKACYAKNFGPKGYGFGQGAGALAYTQ